MIESILSQLSSFIISTIGAMGYAGIVLLMAIESACIPLPSEIILPFSGYLILSGRFSLWGVALAGALGCNLGSLVAYYAGAYGGRSFLINYGKYVLVSRRDMDMADRWFERYGQWTVFFARLLPVIRTFIALPAGIVRMNVWKFHLFTFLGSFPWCLALALAGYQLGVHWDALRPIFHKFDFLIAGMLVAGAAAFLWHHLRNGIDKDANSNSSLSPPSNL